MTTFRILPWLFLAIFPIASAAARPVTVVAANMIIADMVREVGGNAVKIACLARSGADLHAFEPQATDVRALADADLVVLNGLGLEPWIDKLVRNSGFRGTVIEACDGVDVITERDDHAEDAGSHAHDHAADPHAWHEPASARIYVRNIRNALAAAAPESTDQFAAGEAQFLTKLERIDSWAREAFSALPTEHRRFVTSHDSLAYLGRAYGIEIISVTGIAASAEPSAKRVAEVIDLIRASGVRAVFVDAADNPALMRRIATDTGVRIGGSLLTDGLDAPGTGADSYLGMMEQNLRRILDSLQ
ncbi:MAG TPA: zinc ABC transporter substrate-binding protein [Opitutaceae bacterium]|nr:zinc ABC transporter substrate-binding protein [Opitutaceae bacterium]